MFRVLAEHFATSAFRFSFIVAKRPARAPAATREGAYAPQTIEILSSRGLGQLSGGIFLGTLLDRADIGDQSDLHDGAIFKTGTLFRDFDRLVLIRDLKIEVTADCLLRFRERDRRQ